MKFYICNFQTDFSDWWFMHFLWNCPNMNVIGIHWWSVNIGSSNGLVPTGHKPLPEPILTQICRHMASLGHNELTWSAPNHCLNQCRNNVSWTRRKNFPWILSEIHLFLYQILFWKWHLRNIGHSVSVSMCYGWCFICTGRWRLMGSLYIWNINHAILILRFRLSDNIKPAYTTKM